MQYIRTPLINAAISGKVAVVKWLLESSACVDAQDKVHRAYWLEHDTRPDQLHERMLCM